MLNNLIYQSKYKEISVTKNEIPKIKNNKKFTLKIPAIKVNGSPITGTHANNKDHLPNFLKYIDDFSNCVSLNGNHFFVVRFLE